MANYTVSAFMNGSSSIQKESDLKEICEAHLRQQLEDKGCTKLSEPDWQFIEDVRVWCQEDGGQPDMPPEPGWLVRIDGWTEE